MCCRKNNAAIGDFFFPIIKYWQSLSKSKKRMKILMISCLLGPRIVARLHFFRYIVSLFGIFLASYQTDDTIDITRSSFRYETCGKCYNTKKEV